MARTNVLKFGNWDTEENVPYTTYFENARVSSRDKVKSTSSSPNPDLETRKGSEAVRAKHENMEEGELHRSYDSQARLDAGRKASINSSHNRSAGVSSTDTPKRAARADRGGFRSADHSPLHPHYQAKISAKGGAISSVEEEGEMQRSYDSPLRLDAGRKASINSSHYRPAGVSSGMPKRAAGGNGGGFRSADHSPLHPHYQAKIVAKGGAVSSPSRERKGSSEGSHGLAPSTPGRSRLRPVPRGNETPDRGASVPKFGEWDDTDPTSADGFTHIFDKVKEERHGSIGNTFGTATRTVHSDRKKHHKSKNSKGCWCLPW